MNLYLDTNILYSDPFFESFLGNLILMRAKDGLVNIYVSEVALMELNKQLIDRIRKVKSDLGSSVQHYNRLTGKHCDFEFKSESDIHSHFVAFYDKCLKDGLIKKLYCEEQDYKLSVKKAVHHEAPFFKDKKEEFRDSLIWHVALSHATKQAGVKSYFLTGNYQDFWNQDRTNLHPTLKGESKGQINICSGYKHLFDLEEELQDFKISEEFRAWYENQTITIEMLQEAFDKYIWNNVGYKLNSNVSKTSITELNPEFELGFIIADIRKEDVKVRSIISETVKASYVDLEVELDADFNAKMYLPDRQKGDFSNIVSTRLKSRVVLNCAYNQDNLFQPIGIEITKTEMTEDSPSEKKQ